jgi:hydrogenase nickel incorporation protein HypA/HybF
MAVGFVDQGPDARCHGPLRLLSTLSVISALIDEVLRQLEGHKVLRVDSVTIQVGELTFLSEESLKFGYETLSEGTALAGSKLKIERLPANIQCERCGYRGPFDKSGADPHLHFLLPSFECPKCKAPDVRLVSGRETILTHIHGEVKDEEKKKKKTVKGTKKTGKKEAPARKEASRTSKNKKKKKVGGGKRR